MSTLDCFGILSVDYNCTYMDHKNKYYDICKCKYCNISWNGLKYKCKNKDYIFPYYSDIYEHHCVEIAQHITNLLRISVELKNSVGINDIIVQPLGCECHGIPRNINGYWRQIKRAKEDPFIVAMKKLMM